MTHAKMRTLIDGAPAFALPSKPQPADTPTTPTLPKRFMLLTADELAALPPLRWRVRNVLPAEGLAAIFGPSGSGKSFLTLDLLASVAAGRGWFGHRVTACPVVYVALEGAGGLAQRVQAYRVQHGSLPAAFRFIAGEPFRLLEPADVAALADAVRAAGGTDGIVCLDTLAQATPGADENAAQDMTRAIAAAQKLQAALGGLVLLVHHTGKDATKGLRGHSSLHAALDAAIETQREGDHRAWGVLKSKDGADDVVRQFRLDVVELGHDADGEPVTSCVVQPQQAAGDAVRTTRLPQGGNQRIVWDALGELLRKSADFGQAGAPPTRPCIRLDDAVAACHGRLACATDRQAERTRQAFTGLVARGLLNLQDGWLWLP